MNIIFIPRFSMKYLIIVLFCTLSLTTQGQDKTAKSILALGDSITQGGSSYRRVLVPKLKEKNLSYTFIGPNKDKISAHAGYGGKNSFFLSKRIKKIYSEYKADIVMIHAGHNNNSKSKPVSKIIDQTESIITTIMEINPNATILLGQVIPSGKLPKYSYIPKLNKELAVLSEKLIQKKHKVILVNHADGFDWKTDCSTDKVHPNLSGATKMANKWLEALLKLKD